MKRRSFLATVAATAAPVAPAGRMKLGTQNFSDPDSLRVLAALGVHDICSALPSPKMDDKWSVEGLTKLREMVESCGIRLQMVPLPMSSHPIERAEMPEILTGKSPDRDRRIDEICQMIRNCARAGIPAVKYNLTFLGVVRTGTSEGRGGARLSRFDYAKSNPEAPGIRVPADVCWERIDYFLASVVPVAAENRVRMALHPNDPGLPQDRPFHGVDAVLACVDGLKKFVATRESPWHGLNFCQGTISEMLNEPRREIVDVIRWFGSRQKIFNVHFRNIRGRLGAFEETFPDDGDVDMVACLRAYKEVGYDGMLMPDHAPDIAGDAGKRQAFAFAFGYIRGLMQALAA